MSHGQQYTITTEGAEALAAATAETLLQVRGASTCYAKITAFGVSFDGVTAGATPVRVRLLRQTTDGTGTGATECPSIPDGPAAGCTGFHSFSAEPTAGEVLFDKYIHPQGGSIDIQYPLGREHQLDSVNTSRIGLEVNAPAVVNAVAYLSWEE